MELFINNGCVPISDSSGKETWFAITATGAIYGYKKRSDSQGHVLSVIRNVGTTKQNSNMLTEWGIDFSYPKPVFLLQYLIQIFTRKGENDLVVDFFAGSGTTGHGIMVANAKDGGNRHFILTQLPEPTEGSSRKLRTIADITKERLRRAGKKIKEENPMFAGDLGLRVFKLDSTNIREWDPNRKNIAESLEKSVDHLKENRSEQDILFELLLKLGLDLCVPIEDKKIAGHTVQSVGAGTLIVCLSEKIAKKDVEALAKGIIEWHKELKPAGETTIVFRDSAFPDDVAKTNLTAILAQSGLETVRSL